MAKCVTYVSEQVLPMSPVHTMGAGGLRISRAAHPALREFNRNLLNIVTPLQEWAAGWRHRFVRRDGYDGACASNADGVSGHGGMAFHILAPVTVVGSV